MSDWIKPTVAILAPHIGGVIGGYIAKPNIPTWFEHLRKPSFTPPNWVFLPAWTSLYTAMGCASYLVWRDGGGFSGKAALPLTAYCTQLALNWAWSPIFYGAHKLGLATIDISLCLGTVVVTACMFHPINRAASYLMLPAIAWLGFETALTFRIWQDNKEKPKEE